MHGTILLNRIRYLMNCEANPNQTVCQQNAVGFQRANEKLREEDKKKPNDTGQPPAFSDSVSVADAGFCSGNRRKH